MDSDAVEKQPVVPDFWSDEIRLNDFLAWLDERHKDQMQPDVYRRARHNCAELLAGRGVPKSLLTPRRRFCSGVPLDSLRLDWGGVEASALDVANLYGGASAVQGGLLWCVRRLRAYGDVELEARVRERRRSFYAFLCATERVESDVGMLRERGVLRLVASFAGIRAPVVCSDKSCDCVFSSCQVPDNQVKFQRKSKAKPRKGRTTLTEILSSTC